MKKVILSFALVFGCLTFANAQQNALGVQFNVLNYGGISVSYQHSLSNSNRLEFNLGTNVHRRTLLSVSGLYQWVWDVPDARGFRWYAGTGVSFGSDGFASFGRPPGLKMNVLGNIGFEYNFNFPLQLAFDYTAGVGIGRYWDTYNFAFHHNDNHWESGFRLSARWRF